MRLGFFITAIIIIFKTQAADAVCFYKGNGNARTTIAEEFHDARWVVRAKVSQASDHFPDAGDAWTLYRIDVLHSYKGSPARHLRFFTFRDSGGFYMDRAWVPLPARHDIGNDYLLFLNLWSEQKDLPPEAKGAVFVNYSCGMSRPWAKVSVADRERLNKLSLGQQP